MPNPAHLNIAEVVPFPRDKVSAPNVQEVPAIVLSIDSHLALRQDRFVPPIGVIVDYHGCDYAVIGWLKRVFSHEADSIRQCLQACSREEASWVALLNETTSEGLIAHMEDVTISGFATWPNDVYHDALLDQAHAIAKRKRVFL